jgi:hypothetical protein
MTSVLQPWVQSLTFMQQTVLLTAIRGPDGVGKYHASKYLLRWFRRCILLSALDGRVLTDPIEDAGGSFTGPSVGPGLYGIDYALPWPELIQHRVDNYMQTLDELPHHFQMHFMHAAEIIGYKHPDELIRNWWRWLYRRLVADLHLEPETEEQLDRRLGDSREQWLASADPATSD